MNINRLVASMIAAFKEWWHYTFYSIHEHPALRHGAQIQYTGRYAPVLVELDYIATLKHDWDGQQAKPIAKGVINTVRTICEELESFSSDLPVPTVDPCTNGTLDMRWIGLNGTARLHVGKIDYQWAFIPYNQADKAIHSTGCMMHLGEHPAAELDKMIKLLLCQKRSCKGKATV